MKSYGVTIQMKPLQQYFHMVLFIFKYFTELNLGFVLNLILGTLESERVTTENSLVENLHRILIHVGSYRIL